MRVGGGKPPRIDGFSGWVFQPSACVGRPKVVVATRAAMAPSRRWRGETVDSWVGQVDHSCRMGNSRRRAMPAIWSAARVACCPGSSLGVSCGITIISLSGLSSRLPLTSLGPRFNIWAPWDYHLQIFHSSRSKSSRILRMTVFNCDDWGRRNVETLLSETPPIRSRAVRTFQSRVDLGGFRGHSARQIRGC